MLSFFLFDLDNFVKKARQELAHFIKREARTQFIQVVKPGSKRWLFSVIFSHHSTLLVWRLCVSSGHWVCLFHRRVWTSVYSIALKIVVTEESLGLEKTHGLLQRCEGGRWLWDRCPAAAFTWIKRRAQAIIQEAWLWICLALESISCNFSGMDYGALAALYAAEKTWSEGLQRCARFV